jgi:hypothetical protein
VCKAKLPIDAAVPSCNNRTAKAFPCQVDNHHGKIAWAATEHFAERWKAGGVHILLGGDVYRAPDVHNTTEDTGASERQLTLGITKTLLGPIAWIRRVCLLLAVGPFCIIRKTYGSMYNLFVLPIRLWFLAVLSWMAQPVGRERRVSQLPLERGRSFPLGTDDRSHTTYHLGIVWGAVLISQSRDRDCAPFCLF